MTDDDLKGLFAALQRENAGMREENAAAHAETRRHVEVLTEETRRHVEVLTEATRKDIQLVAESVVLLSDKLDRTASSLDEKIDRTAAETKLRGDPDRSPSSGLLTAPKKISPPVCPVG